MYLTSIPSLAICMRARYEDEQMNNILCTNVTIIIEYGIVATMQGLEIVDFCNV